MPFQSKVQMRGAFGGFLGPEMKRKAQEFANETPNINKLPFRKRKPVSRRKPKLTE